MKKRTLVIPKKTTVFAYLIFDELDGDWLFDCIGWGKSKAEAEKVKKEDEECGYSCGPIQKIELFPPVNKKR